MTRTGGTDVNNMDGKKHTEVSVWACIPTYIYFSALSTEGPGSKDPLVAMDTQHPDLGF